MGGGTAEPRARYTQGSVPGSPATVYNAAERTRNLVKPSPIQEMVANRPVAVTGPSVFRAPPPAPDLPDPHDDVCVDLTSSPGQSNPVRLSPPRLQPRASQPASARKHLQCKWRLMERELSGSPADIRCPMWALPTTTRSFRLHFSYISQIDGFASKCRGRGARIERDVLAPSGPEAVCHIHGHAAWSSPGSYCGLYLCDFEFMPAVVATVASHRGYGFFVVPCLPAAHPAIVVQRQSSDGTKVWRSYGWYDYLMSYSLMVFDLPHDAFVTLSDRPLRFPHNVRVVLAQFGRNGNFKAIPRQEHTFRLRRIPRLDANGPKLGVRPVLLHMSSPFADEAFPSLADDACPATAPPNYCPDVPVPKALPSRWTSAMPAFKRLAESYPHSGVAGLAVSVLEGNLNPYRGSLSKPVVYASQRRDDVSEVAKRAAMMKEVALPTPRIVGPLPACPFEAARVCPTSTVNKDPYDPKSTRLRLISNFSKCARGWSTGSVNHNCWSPKLLSFHAQPSHIRYTLAWIHLVHGPGVVAWTADVPSCFRLNRLHPAILSLFVYLVHTAEHGSEWFVDLANPFGWTPAEWGWQCVLALILWAFRCEGMIDMFAFVDNFFNIVHPAAIDTSTTALFDRIASIFKSLSVPLHEEMVGTRFKGLGWMWELDVPSGLPEMVCAQDKYDHLCRQLTVWHNCPTLTFVEVESIIGFLVWISAGFPIGRPHIAYLRECLVRHRRRRAHTPADSVNERDQMVTLRREAREAIAFWHRFFPHWDMRCSVFLDFGPMAGPEVLWRYDASTDWGCGAFMWVIDSTEAVFIAHKWTTAESKQAIVHKRESTGVMEGMAAARCARAFARTSAGKRVLMEGDNQALTTGIARCYSPTRLMMVSIHSVCDYAARHRVCVRSSHIKGVSVPVVCTPFTRVSCAYFCVRQLWPMIEGDQHFDAGLATTNCA